jgi:hypothetical protein
MLGPEGLAGDHGFVGGLQRPETIGIGRKPVAAARAWAVADC